MQQRPAWAVTVAATLTVDRCCEQDDEDEVYGDDGDETDDAEFDDDEDQTWKVRSAAAKCVAAIGMLPGMDASAEVVSSLIERVEHESSTA